MHSITPHSANLSETEIGNIQKIDVFELEREFLPKRQKGVAFS